jgi:NAD+ dependent glucose-6-phosphate dehydrogenase
MTAPHHNPLLVVTGGAGRIGTFYRAWLAGEQDGAPEAQPWRVRLVDLREPSGARPGDEVTAGDAADMANLDAARHAVTGAHTVLHLAADPSPVADFYESLLDRNIKATYNILHAATEAGVKRVVFASSVNAVNGYPVSRQSRASDVPFPGNVYGASKAWGEAVCAAFVAQSNGAFSAIAIRIGGVTAREAVNLEVNAETQAFRVTYHDLARLFDACVSGAPHVTFAVVNGISNNRYLRMDLEETRQLVGYHPQDDAFALAEENAARTR